MAANARTTAKGSAPRIEPKRPEVARSFLSGRLNGGGGQPKGGMPNERPMSGPRRATNTTAGLARLLAQEMREGVAQMAEYTEGPSIPVVVEADELALFARYGVGDLVGLEGTEDRVVEIAPSTNVVCPMHSRRLVPDACRSCRFLAGEVRPVPLT
jgi:hypothetical protein